MTLKRLFPIQTLIRITILLFAISFIMACNKDKIEDEIEDKIPLLSEDFESGSIGEVLKISDEVWELSLADDNDNSTLPKTWRNWWYVKMENLSVTKQIDITLKNRGWSYYYLPVFSYGQNSWQRYSADEVSQNENNELIMRRQFNNPEVSIARFYPYTLTDLENYIERIDNNQYIDIQTAGYSQEGRPIYIYKLTDTQVTVSSKKRILMHARTHPAETPPSFLLEGMIDFLLGGSQEASEILSKFEFYIFPMQNVDGVVAGNYRSTPKTDNLEVMWYYDSSNPHNLTDDAPLEVKIVHQYAKDLMEEGGVPISMALNLHASNSEPDVRPFFFPHFGSESQGYSPIEASLWDKQIRFINSVANQYGDDMIEPTSEEGGSSFASKTYPESWWWVNYKDQVMAITMEMTYGQAGYSPRWIEPDDLRDLGVSLALSIRDYYDETFTPAQRSLKSGRKATLKFPELYPPDDIDEMKK